MLISKYRNMAGDLPSETQELIRRKSSKKSPKYVAWLTELRRNAGSRPFDNGDALVAWYVANEDKDVKRHTIANALRKALNAGVLVKPLNSAGYSEKGIYKFNPDFRGDAE